MSSCSRCGSEFRRVEGRCVCGHMEKDPPVSADADIAAVREAILLRNPVDSRADLAALDRVAARLADTEELEHERNRFITYSEERNDALGESRRLLNEAEARAEAAEHLVKEAEKALREIEYAATREMINTTLVARVAGAALAVLADKETT